VLYFIVVLRRALSTNLRGAGLTCTRLSLPSPLNKDFLSSRPTRAARIWPHRCPITPLGPMGHQWEGPGVGAVGRPGRTMGPGTTPRMAVRSWTPVIAARGGPRGGVEVGGPHRRNLPVAVETQREHPARPTHHGRGFEPQLAAARGSLPATPVEHIRAMGAASSYSWPPLVDHSRQRRSESGGAPPRHGRGFEPQLAAARVDAARACAAVTTARRVRDVCWPREPRHGSDRRGARGTVRRRSGRCRVARRRVVCARPQRARARGPTRGCCP
jgi:hypothetical protein